MWRSSVLGCRDVKTIIWARGDRISGICLIYNSALRSSSQIHWDIPWWYMDFPSLPWVMNSWCISEEYHTYTVERVIGILRHMILSCHIALHPMISFILDDYVFYWWLKSTWYLIFSIWWTLYCVLLMS